MGNPLKSPSNGPRAMDLHKTYLDEHFRIKGRTKQYEGIDEMQKDLGGFMMTTTRPGPTRVAT